MTYKKNIHRHWIRLAIRVAQQYFKQTESSSQLINKSYDTIAQTYDTFWTVHIKTLSEDLLHQLNPWTGATALDLTCGTGFVTAKLAKITQTKATGIDASAGMIAVAKNNYANSCRFIQSNVLTYLQQQPSSSIDLVTCCWGLGYLQPLKIIKEIARVLRPGGKCGIIDHSLLSNWEVIRSLIIAFAEKPEAYSRILKTQYLANNYSLILRMRWCGLSVKESWNGVKTREFIDGRTAVEQWIKSGAAAGFESIIKERHRSEVLKRIAELLESQHSDNNTISITHRYFAAVAIKPHK